MPKPEITSIKLSVPNPKRARLSSSKPRYVEMTPFDYVVKNGEHGQGKCSAVKFILLFQTMEFCFYRSSLFLIDEPSQEQ